MLCMYFGYVGKVEDREKAARVERRLMYCLGACPLCLMLLLHTGCKGLQAPSCCCCPPPLRLVRGADEGAGVRWLWQVRVVDEVERAVADGLQRYPRARHHALPYIHAPGPCLARASSPEAQTHLDGPRRCLRRLMVLRFPTSHSHPLAMQPNFPTRQAWRRRMRQRGVLQG